MSWFSKPLNKGIAIGAGVLALVAIALIIYGVVTHTEETIMEVCWDGNQAVYEEGSSEGEEFGREVSDGPCEGHEELVWPQEQVPFTVAAFTSDHTDAEAPGSSGRKGLDAAIRDLNQQFGFDILRPVSDPGGAAFVAHLGAAVDVSPRRSKSGAGKARRAPLGWASHTRYRNGSDGPERLRCDLFVSSAVGSLRGEYLVAHHELLHCIGFGHDHDNPASAIYPFTHDDTMWSVMQAARVTDRDRAKGRDLYHR